MVVSHRGVDQELPRGQKLPSIPGHKRDSGSQVAPSAVSYQHHVFRGGSQQVTVQKDLPSCRVAVLHCRGETVFRGQTVVN